MIIPYKSKVFKALKHFFRSSNASSRYIESKKDIISCDTSIPWSQRDTLVGVLRTTEQLNIALKYNFYHIPDKYVSEYDLPIKYIAIYQSKSLFGNKSGIYYYGEVASYRCIKRKDIHEIKSNSNEYYYRFDIKQWKLLKNPIEAKELGFVRLYTNFEMMLNSTEIPQLLMKNKEIHEMYCKIKNTIITVQNNPQTQQSILRYGDHNIVVELDDLILFKNAKPIISFSVYDFLDLPNTIMTQIYKYMKL